MSNEIRHRSFVLTRAQREEMSTVSPSSIERAVNKVFGREKAITRAIRILLESRRGFLFLKRYEKSVTFFGSARDHLSPRMYTEATKLARLLAQDGFAVMSGGGGGIMEAANKGSFEVGGRSVGLNIELPNGQRQNVYVNEGMPFRYFFIRKLMLTFSARAYIFFPGGFGTLDEFFEVVTLTQTKKIEIPIPIIVVGKEYWEPIFKWVDDVVYERFAAIDKEDQALYHLVDTAEEAYMLIQDEYPKR